jgi:hypothetical protein
MRTRTWMLMATLAVATTLATAARGQPGREAQPAPPKAAGLSEEEQRSVDRAGELRKQLRITRLELLLLEAKEASEEEIAAKAEHLYRLQGKLHALRAKHPGLAQKLRPRARQQARGAGPGRRGDGWWGPGMGRGPTFGPGMGRGGPLHKGGRGMGPGLWQRQGGGPGPGMGPGRRPWVAEGPRRDIGPEGALGRRGQHHQPPPVEEELRAEEETASQPDPS